VFSEGNFCNGDEFEDLFLYKSVADGFCLYVNLIGAKTEKHDPNI